MFRIKALIKWVAFALGLLVVALLILPPLLQPQGVEPMPEDQASIRIYGANVWGFRGYFAIHTWVATRLEDEDNYTIHQVIGWQLRRTGTVLSRHEGAPDRPWFGNEAILLHEVNGAEAARLIPRVRAAVYSYPFKDQYTMFPGPNSNSFTEWVAQEVPEIELQLPAKAIGRIWMRNYHPQHSSAD